ncbi:MAG: tetratricopeptide repeat protein [Planctomycetes bacterium]|nr:tetratricopeptide repeat protein [Planctomycetota bacterium]
MEPPALSTAVFRPARRALVLGALGIVPPLGLLALLLGRSARKSSPPAARAEATTAVVLGGIFTTLHLALAWPAWTRARDWLDRRDLAPCLSHAESVRQAILLYRTIHDHAPATLDELLAGGDGIPEENLRCPSADSADAPPHYRIVPEDLDGADGILACETRSRHRRGRVVVRRGGVSCMPEREFTAIEPLLDPARRLERGRMKEEAGDFPGAVREYGAAARLAPQDPEGHLAKGRLFLRQGDVEGAAQTYDFLLLIAPDEPRARAGLGFVRLAQGDVWGAQTEFQVALSSTKPPAETHLGLARVSVMTADPAAAALSYARFLEAAGVGHPDLDAAREEFLALGSTLFAWKARAESDAGQAAEGLAQMGQYAVAQALAVPERDPARIDGLLNGMRLLREIRERNPRSTGIAGTHLAACRDIVWSRGVPPEIRRAAIDDGLRLLHFLSGWEQAPATHRSGALLFFLAKAYPLASRSLDRAGLLSWDATESDREIDGALRTTLANLGLDSFVEGEPERLATEVLLTPYRLDRQVDATLQKFETVWIATAREEGLRLVCALVSQPEGDGRRHDLYAYDLGQETILESYGAHPPAPEAVQARVREHAAALLRERPYAFGRHGAALEEASEALRQAGLCLDEMERGY